jgi:hypothetical protein
MKKNKGGNSRQRRTHRRFNRHHIVAKSHSGPATQENLLVMDIDKHNAYHKVFGNRSFLDVVRLLIRVLRAKKHPDYYPAQAELEDFENDN